MQGEQEKIKLRHQAAPRMTQNYFLLFIYVSGILYKKPLAYGEAQTRLRMVVLSSLMPDLLSEVLETASGSAMAPKWQSVLERKASFRA